MTKETVLQEIDAELTRLAGKPRRERQLADLTAARAKIESMSSEAFAAQRYGADGISGDVYAVVLDVIGRRTR